MPAVLAQVNGDPIGSTQMRFNGSPDGIRFVGAARLANGGHMVDIDAKFDHSSCSSIKILRVSRRFPPVW